MVNIESRVSAEEAIGSGADPVDFLGNPLAGDFVEGIIERVRAAKAEARAVGWVKGSRL